MKAQGSILVAIVILLLIAGVYSYFFYYNPSIELNITKNTTATTSIVASSGNNLGTSQTNVVTLNAPAVDNQETELLR